ncbi:MAG: extracellular solute-binding protein [Chloroflexota bacterium]
MSQFTRRQFLNRLGVAGAGLAAMLAGCQPKVVEVTRVVEKQVEKVVEKTVVVKEAVEVAKEVTRVVEKQVQAPQPTKGPVNLAIWSMGPLNPDAAAWKDYQVTFKKILADKVPGATYTFKDMGWDEVLRQNMVTGLLGGTAPDVIVGESFIQPYARIGAYLQLDDGLTDIKKNLIPGTYANAVADGKIYGISQYTGVFAFESNPNVVKQAGLDPNEWPKTWSQLLERCAAITKAGKDKFYGYTLQGPVGFLVGGIMRYNVFANLAGVTLCKDDCQAPFFDDPKLEPVLAFIRELNRYTPPGLTFNPNEGQVYSQLHEGISAYQIGAPWHMQWAIEAKIEDVIQYGPLPKPDQGGKDVSRTVGNPLVMVLSGSKFPRESIEFIKITQMDEITDYVYVATNGRSPSTYSGLQRTLPKIKPQHKIFFEILQTAAVGAMPQWTKATDKVWTTFNEMMQKLLTTEDPIAPLQQAAQAAAEAAYKAG